MKDMTVKEVDYRFCKANMQTIVKLVTEAFMGNHKITKAAYNNTAEIYKEKFIDLLNKSTEDMIEQCQKHKGMFFVAECQQKIIGFSMGSPYSEKGMSDEFVASVFQSQCSFKEVMKGWWDLMGKYEGTPPGKIFHQGPMAIAPEFAGRGIGAQLCALTAKRILETGYDGLAVETSSESADSLAEKMKKAFRVIDLDSNGAGLTFRLHLHQNDRSERIHQWFLSKKEIHALPKEINVKEISKIGVPVTIMLQHPNSKSRLFFKKQREDTKLTDRFRFIAIDLPEHGESKPAEEPKATYTFSGYAQELAHTVNQLGTSRLFEYRNSEVSENN